MTVNDATTTASSPVAAGRGRRSTWFRAVAAPAMAIIGSVALLACDDSNSGTDASTGTTLSAAETAEAEQFISAFNARDLPAIEAMSTNEFTFNSAVTGGKIQADDLPSLMAWYDAFDWRWEDTTCETTSVRNGIRCKLFEQNRLTDLTGAERPARMSFTMTGGKVESVTVNANVSDYRDAFYRFNSWVWANYPDDAERMWTAREGRNPVLSAESAALLDQHLTEYADQLPPTTDD